jgi:UDP-glucose:(heptosyl)LPS alpha-1,3-glucosyltransferase
MERRMFGGRNYRRLIALTSEVKADLERFYGVPSEDVEVLPNGFSAAEFHPGVSNLFREATRQRLRIDPGAWVVLFVANEWERKGLIPLMEALGSWNQPDVHLIVAGRLPEQRLRMQAETSGLSGRVHFVGGGEAVNRWFGAADAFALPTLYEAWGMVIVEALACGLPVLTSACAGAAVAVRDGVTGLLLDNPQSVSEVRAGLMRLRENQHPQPSLIAESVAGYRWERVLGAYEQILEGAL